MLEMDEETFVLAWEIVVPLDWLDEAAAFYWVARGKVKVWFDYLAWVKCGFTGGDLEGELALHGIEIYAKLVIPDYSSGDLPAFVLVDSKKEARARRILAEWGILL